MKQPYERSSRLAHAAGISLDIARSNLRHGALQHHSIEGQEAQKFVARQRFAQRLKNRHDKHMVELADNLRPRVVIDMGDAK